MRKKYNIWKLQRPIASNEVFPTIMAYTEGKAQMAMIPMGEELMDRIFGDEYKVYAKAQVINGVLKVKRLVPDQDW